MRNKSFPSGHTRGQLMRVGDTSGFVLVVASLLPLILSSTANASGRHSEPPQCVPTSASTIVPAQSFPTQLATYSPPPIATGNSGAVGNNINTSVNATTPVMFAGNAASAIVPAQPVTTQPALNSPPASVPSNNSAGGNNGNGGGTAVTPIMSGGGGGGNPFSGGGNSNSGGAPSPEVNTILGLTLAGGTAAFLRRRSRDRTASAA